MSELNNYYKIQATVVSCTDYSQHLRFSIFVLIHSGNFSLNLAFYFALDSTRNIHVGYCDTTVIANPVASYIANDANMDYMSSTPPPGNDSVVLEMPGITR